MTEVVSVRFSCHSKVYYFDPNGVYPNPGDKLIVETAKGLDVGECAQPVHEVEDDAVIQPLRPVVRVATPEDMQTVELNKKKEKEAFAICKEKIAQHGLDMKLVDVECSFEGNKILFFFTSDGRVDFRELVKDLASVFRTRIELRQIGVRDETKMLGGIGICGRPYCCNQFLTDFEPVSTKMAKTQSMSLNPTKISGSCGRLMCCLRYEEDAYEELIKTIPKTGAFVQTTEGYGNVVQTNILRQKVRVHMDGEGDPEVKNFDADQVVAIPGGRPKPGEPVPDILVYVAKEKEPDEPEADPWVAPDLFAESESERKAEKQVHDTMAEEQEQQPRKPRNRNRNRNRSGQKKPPLQGAEAPRPQARQGGEAPGKPAQNTQAPKQPNAQASGQQPAAKPKPNRPHHRRPNRPKNPGQPSQPGTPAAPKN